MSTIVSSTTQVGRGANGIEYVYQDSDTSTCLSIRLQSLAVAVVALCGAARVWRDGSR
jgi:hypothetical protein